MRRPTFAGLAFALLLAPAPSTPAAPTAPACGEAFPTYDPTPAAEPGETFDAELTMSDGVVLRATVALPAGAGPFPTALTITGYNRQSGLAAADLLAHGYATVVVDDRGTGTSGGAWDSWGERTRADYREVLDWIVAQPWSDGRVGVTGASYMGITSLFTAATGHPAVRAVFATVPMADAYRDITFAGGQVNVAFVPLWMGLVTTLSALPNADPATIAEHLANVTEFQLPSIAGATLGDDIAYDGPFWRQRSPVEAVPDIDVPTFVVGGLDDLFQRGEPLLYEALVANGVDARLLIGPWSHLGGSSGAGLPAQGVPSLAELRLQWFDEHVRGLDAGAACIPQVTQYVRGEERWRTAPSWPLPELTASRWHLRGDGTLTTDAPTSEEPGRTYPQLPVSGPCSRSTAQWLIGVLDNTPCATDNRLDEATSLTWTSEPLDAPLTIDGPIQADVWVTTTGNEATVSVAVSDVAPDGSSRGLTNGLLVASHRAVDAARSRRLDGQSIQPWHPFTEEALLPVVPGEPMLLPVEVFPTSATLAAGHRLRITIAAHDVPHALPPLPAAAATAGGLTTVLSDPAHPSSVVLPVAGASASTRAAPSAGASTVAGTGADADAGGAAGEVLARTGTSASATAAVAAAVLALALAVRRRLRPDQLVP